jgi:hypothetical protein
MMPYIPTADPDLLHLAAVRSSERWNNYLSTGEPTYWPSHRNKLPDLDFCGIEGIPTTPPSLGLALIYLPTTPRF